MIPSDKRKNKSFPSEFKGGTKTPEAEIKLKQTNELKYDIIDAFQKGKLRKFWERVGFLIKNQANNKKLLAKSLCDITKQIPDNDIKLELFAEALEANPSDTVTLTSYATALANDNQFDKAFELFEQSKDIKPDDTVTLNSYATALANDNQFDKAFELFELSLKVIPDNRTTLFLYAIVLEITKDYNQALLEMEKIDLNKLSRKYSGFICLNLGRLCYLTKQEQKGNYYFDLYIEYYPKPLNAAKLDIAKQLFMIDSYNPIAVSLLKNIKSATIGHGQAATMLKLNFDVEEYFEEFNSMTDQYDIKTLAELNSEIYHKILNEISILKIKSYTIIRDEPAIEIQPIINNIEEVVVKIKHYRKLSQTNIDQIPTDNYQEIIAIISKTAHDISDFVNNEMATIESKIRFLIYDLDKTTPIYSKFDKLLQQVEFTQESLNGLKSINEAVKINSKTFQVKQLFENLLDSPKFDNATVELNIKNGDNEFYGDKQKIIGFLTELLENSLKHNKDNDFQINITSQDIIELPSHLVTPVPTKTNKMLAKKKYLAIIYTDNGIGIPKDKKDWILLPLKTTSDTGSGLGLFIIKKILKEMNGYIIETGTNGVRFEIYIPYI